MGFEYPQQAVAAWNTRAPATIQPVQLPKINEFRINPVGGENIQVEGNEWFCHAHEVKAFAKAAKAAIGSAPVRESSAWQPIDTAPEGWIVVPREDGLFSGRSIVCRCDERDKGYGVNYLDEEGNGLEINPKFWALLPGRLITEIEGGSE